MNSKTGAIAKFETPKDAVRAGFDVPLTSADEAALAVMSRRERLDWLGRHPEKQATKPRNRFKIRQRQSR